MIALTPAGRPLTQEVVEQLAAEDALTLLSARFEGFDERIVEHLATDAISIGPYVLSGGELPAMVMLDAIARRLPGALGSEESGLVESFLRELDGGLEYPQYTRPAEFRGWNVPDVLLSGNHGRIARMAPGAERRIDRLSFAIAIVLASRRDREPIPDPSSSMKPPHCRGRAPAATPASRTAAGTRPEAT